MMTAAIVFAVFGAITGSAEHVAKCENSVQGMKIWIRSTIDVHRKDLSPRLNEVDFPTYCRCFHKVLREALGNDLYERSQSLKGEMTPAELSAWNEQDRKAVIACVEAPLAARNAPSGRHSDAMSGGERYVRFIRSTLAPGHGVGGLKLGDAPAALFRVLGPTKTFQRTADGGDDYYYGPNSIEVIVSLSPPPARTVRQITLSRHFAGQTAEGGRIGDTREKIKRAYSGKLAVDLPGYAVYCDGTTFLFRNGRLDSIRLAELAADVFRADRRKHCSR